MESENVLLSSANAEKLSMTLKAVAASALVILKIAFGIEIVNEQVNQVIDALLILVINGIALYGYIRAKKVLGARIQKLGAVIEEYERVGKAQ